MLPVQEFFKSVYNCQSYGRKTAHMFFYSQCIGLNDDMIFTGLLNIAVDEFWYKTETNFLILFEFIFVIY